MRTLRVLLLLAILPLAASAQIATGVKTGTPPSLCSPTGNNILVDTSTTPPSIVQCAASGKWTRVNTGGVNAQTGTSYPFVAADRNKLVTSNNGSAVAWTLPQATSAGDFLNGWTVYLYNRGAGTVTITPTTSTINGAATATLAQNEGGVVFSDGTNYSILKTNVGGAPSGSAGGALDGNFPSPGLAASVAGSGLAETSDVLSVNVDGSTLEINSDALRVKDAGVVDAKLGVTTNGLSAPQYGVDSGSNDTYVATLSPAIASYVAGAQYLIKVATANTGAATINLNGLGAKSIKVAQGTADPADGDIKANSTNLFEYDGTNMAMLSTLGNSSSGGTTINSTDLFVPYRVNSTTFGNMPLKFIDTGGGTSVNQFTNGTNLQEVQGNVFANGSASGQDYFRLNGGGGGLDLGTNNSVGFGGGAGYFQGNVSARKGNQVGLKGSAGATFYFPPYSPSQITSNQNDYNASGATNLVIRLNSDASRNITGITVPAGGFGDRQVDGEVHVLINVGAQDIVLKHQDAASTAGNRFLFSTGADITLGADKSITIFYDGTTGRWRNISGTY